MSDLKKKMDKGIAYLKRNGVRKTICRAGRKAMLSREIPYETWLKRQTANTKELNRQKNEMKKYALQWAVCLIPGEEQKAMQASKETLREQSAGNLPVFTIHQWKEKKELWEQKEYILFLQEDCLLRPEAIFEMMEETKKYTEPIVLYTDHDIQGTDGKLKNPFCKPDYDPIWQKQQNYMGPLLLVGKTFAEALCLPEQKQNKREIWQEIQKQMAEQTEKVVHLPKLLYHVTEETEKELEKVQNFPEKDCGGPELLSVIIPNKDHVEDLKTCINSLLQAGGYPNLEILIAENNSTEKETFQWYEEIQKKEKRIRVLTWSGVFNYSAINNFAAQHANGAYLLFLNNDTKIKKKGAIKEMVCWLGQERVGAVGAKLLYEDQTIQHAGVVLGYGGVAGHAFEGMSQEEYEKKRYAKVVRQMSAVTAACIAVKRSAFEQIGGFTEELGVAYNDIDLCMKLRKAGWMVLYDPFVEVYHYESQTRGFEMSTEKAERVKREAKIFCQTWKEEMHRGDPFYSVNLTLEKPDFSLKR